MSTPKPVVLCILDGWGLRSDPEANAVLQAKTPVYDSLVRDVPMATLKTSGQDVGLPDGQMGNSEVGHMNIGAGRVVWMDLPRIDKAIAENDFATRAPFQRFVDRLKASGGVAHVMGLASPGGVHSHQRHLIATAAALAEAGLGVRLHLFLDGRDTAPNIGERCISQILDGLPAGADIRVASVIGRFYAMDRDKRWERVQRAWAAMTLGAEARDVERADDPLLAAKAAAGRGETDEFVSPTVIRGHEGIQDGDGVLMINFRADRAREILAALVDPDFDGFERPRVPRLAAALGMVEYSSALNRFLEALFPQEAIEDTLGAWVAAHGKTQLRLAETEKYPHVTFFLNGGEEAESPGESRHMAPSPKVATYDLAPEMNAAEVTETLTNAIYSQTYDLIVVNFANPDMVGHTGDLQAAIRAVEAVDRGVGEALKAIEKVGGAMLVTADHGNCEMMVDPETGGPHTAHTTNPVPILLVGGRGARLAEGGRLADVAPTLLALMDLPQPAAMTGRSLLVRNEQAA